MSTTTTYLSKVIPGQTPDWYQRIAVLIDNGMMPMPESATIEAPMVTTRRTTTQERPSPAPSSPPRPTQVQAVPRASASIEGQLIERLNGDRKAAERLVRNLAALNPLKSGNWCWEKALWDIDRDRH